MSSTQFDEALLEGFYKKASELGYHPETTTALLTTLVKTSEALRAGVEKAAAEFPSPSVYKQVLYTELLQKEAFDMSKFMDMANHPQVQKLIAALGSGDFSQGLSILKERLTRGGLGGVGAMGAGGGLLGLLTGIFTGHPIAGLLGGAALGGAGGYGHDIYKQDQAGQFAQSVGAGRNLMNSPNGDVNYPAGVTSPTQGDPNAQAVNDIQAREQAETSNTPARQNATANIGGLPNSSLPGDGARDDISAVMAQHQRDQNSPMMQPAERSRVDAERSRVDAERDFPVDTGVIRQPTPEEVFNQREGVQGAAAFHARQNAIQARIQAREQAAKDFPVDTGVIRQPTPEEVFNQRDGVQGAAAFHARQNAANSLIKHFDDKPLIPPPSASYGDFRAKNVGIIPSAIGAIKGGAKDNYHAAAGNVGEFGKEFGNQVNQNAEIAKNTAAAIPSAVHAQTNAAGNAIGQGLYNTGTTLFGSGDEPLPPGLHTQEQTARLRRLQAARGEGAFGPSSVAPQSPFGNTFNASFGN